MKLARTRELLVTAMILLVAATLAAPAFADGDDPPSVVARLSFMSGNVSFQPSGEDQWSQASLNYPLTTGDRVFTDQGGRAELETGNLAVRLSQQTDLTATSLSDHLTQIGLSQGTVRVRAYSLPPDSSIEIDTPNAALTILRPGNYRIETYPDNDTTLVTVTSGDLEISGGDGDAETVHAGQSVKISGANPPQLDWVSTAGTDDFDRWCGDRDRRFTNSNSLQYVSRGVPGYADLDEYGRWESAPQYGQVWYPVAVPAGWVPYRYGHWAWVEPWGWTWIEDEPWGFAPFHYGRWVVVAGRWGWVPAPPVAPRPCYAPALVAFVGGSGFSVSVRVGGGVQAWFPLGPDEPYYPWYHHSDGYLRQVNVTNVRNVTVINNYINVRNVNVTNVTYVNRRVAVTAVSSETFRTSRPVAREVVSVRADEIERARVVEHPEVHPDARAVTGGAVQTHPPAPKERPAFVHATVDARGRFGGDNNRGAGGDNRSREGAHAPRANIDEPPSGANNPPGGGNSRNGPLRENNGGFPGREDHAGQAPTTGNNPPSGTNNPPAGGNNPSGPPRNANNFPERRDNQGQPPSTGNSPPSGTNNPPAGGNNPSGPPRNANNFPGRRDNQGPPPSTAGNGQPAGNPPRTDAHTPASTVTGGQGGNGPQNGQGNNNGPRPLVTRTPPPPQNPPFETRRNAMQDHPGRPLEPQQVQNLQQGKPAGPAHDQEYHGHDQHNQPQNQQQQHPQQNQQQQNQQKDHGKEHDKPH